MGKFLTALLVLAFCIFTALSLNFQDFRELPEASGYYISGTVPDTGVLNIVTAVLFDYRGYDSLMEITLLFTTTTAVSALFIHRRFPWSSQGMNVLTRTGVGWHLPYITLFGLYLLFFGHLSPGGGFQGGVVLATLSVLLSVVYGTGYDRAKLSPTLKSITEAGSALFFLLLGLFGIIAGANFLANRSAGFFIGIPGAVFSGGSVFWLNFFSGLKVAGGLGVIFYAMLKEDKG